MRKTLTALLSLLFTLSTHAQKPEKAELKTTVSQIEAELQQEYPDCEESYDCRAWKRALSRLLTQAEQQKVEDDIERFQQPGTMSHTNRTELRMLASRLESKERRERVSKLLDAIGVARLQSEAK
jgi:hypothetical protein